MAHGGTLDYSFVAGDTDSILSVSCKRSDTGAAIDLTGATVALRYRIDGGTVQTKAMTVDDAPGGVATYTFGSADLTAGLMVAEVEVTRGGKVTSSAEPMRFTVRAKV